MNPFVFLATELRERYKSEWFEAANEREARWAAELACQFLAPRWHCTDRLKVKRNGKIVTDIDFIAYDSKSQTIALFQLKWQQPSISDERVRRNNASSLVGECNKWIATVSEWIEDEGLNLLAHRLDIRRDELTSASLFILGRYDAHFSGYPEADSRAAWSDWGHFERERMLHPSATVTELFENLVLVMNQAKRDVQPESFMVPLPGLVLVVNPIRQPTDP